MNAVQVEQKSYEMPPREGFTVAHFLTVADIDRSTRFYEKVFGGRILSRGDSEGAPAYIQIANTWLLVNVGGGPTPDKPSVICVSPTSGPATSMGRQRSVLSFRAIRQSVRIADVAAKTSSVQIEQKSYEMPPRDAVPVAAAVYAQDKYSLKSPGGTRTEDRDTLQGLRGLGGRLFRPHRRIAGLSVWPCSMMRNSWRNEGKAGESFPGEAVKAKDYIFHPYQKR